MDIVKEMELSFVGSLITYPEKIITVIDIVNPEDFTSQHAKELYLILTDLWRNKKHVNLSSVLMENKALTQILLASIKTAHSFGLKSVARDISLQAKNRRVNYGLDEIQKSSVGITQKLDNILSLYQREMFIHSKEPDIKNAMSRFREKVAENKKSGAIGIHTGFNFLQEKYIQYVPGQVWVMGGFTSAGKTATAIQKICNIIVQDPCPSIVIVSTEMTEEQLISRLVANLTGVHSYRVLSGKYRPGEEEEVVKCQDFLESRNMIIYDDIYTIGDIETVFRKKQLQGGVDLGIIDYIQNCQVPDANSEYQEQSTLAKRVQKLAKDVRATMLCLSQVSNSVGRGDTDQLEFKGAGEWAAVTDIGIMLQRHKTEKYKLKYSVKKNRHGALCENVLEYKMDFTRLEET